VLLRLGFACEFVDDLQCIGPSNDRRFSDHDRGDDDDDGR
jgi:hypothetical protein